MAVDRQSSSGTAFDPAPQFQVYRTMPSAWLAVTGRCLFGPVVIGTVFDTVATRSAGGWETADCQLRVEEIGMFGHVVDQLDQIFGARLVLVGSAPGELTEGMVLVARGPAGSQWQRQGDWWLRCAQPDQLPKADQAGAGRSAD